LDALSLLAGDAATFLDSVWASRPHVHAGPADNLAALLSLEDVDHLLTGTALRVPALRLARDGTVLPAGQYTRSATLAGQPLTGLVDGPKVLNLFDDGATVVLQGLHRYWPPLTRLVRELELALGHPCQANAYLTPPRSQGFAVHSDSHDVFVFQTHGTKHWQVHQSEGVREVTMQPGTSMYLPTGTPHAARAHDTASLHVTVGINQVTWRTLLSRMVGDLLDAQEYDEPIPAGYLDDPSALVSSLEEHARLLGKRLTEHDPEAFASDEARRFLTSRTPYVHGGLSDRVQLSELDDETVLDRRPTAACVVHAAGGQLRVLLGDRELRMPLRLEQPMRLVASQDRISPKDWAGSLDAESRLVLARRLVREGLLRIAR